MCKTILTLTYGNVTMTTEVVQTVQ